MVFPSGAEFVVQDDKVKSPSGTKAGRFAYNTFKRLEFPKLGLS